MKTVKYIVISLFFVPFLVFAQNQIVSPSTSVPVVGSPSTSTPAVSSLEAGLTPENPFYFLDIWGEAIQRFFTFNPASRARLEISFAKERIAEIKLVLEEKGVDAKGLSVAEARLKDNLSRATAIVADQKQAGKDVSGLAQEVSNDFNSTQETLKSTFKSEAGALEVKIEALKARLKEARLASDVAQVEILSKELADLKAQKELLGEHEDKNNNDIEAENDHVDEALGIQKEAAEKIKDLEEKKAEILKEAQDNKLSIPDGTFKEFDALLSQAKAAFDAGKYQDAKNLAKEAKKSIKEIEKQLENLKDAKDEEQDLKDEKDMQKHEFEDKLKEADKKEAEKSERK